MPDEIGAPAIDVHGNPGGVVLRVYAVPSGRRLHTSIADTVAMAAYFAGRHTADILLRLPPDTSVMLIAYSGDTGERLPS